MIVTAELSLYPLQDSYEPAIIAFIQSLKAESEITVHTHAMSTFVKGENKTVLAAIANGLELANTKCSGFSLVTKIINRDLPVENGFLEF
jgi:uncharacterized protein YqgV (UPF0045/DUF77 family)